MKRTPYARPALVILVLLVLAACGGEGPTAQSPSQTPASDSSPTRPPSAHANSILYLTIPVNTSGASDQIDLWLYDVAKDSVTRLTSDGRRTTESNPRFHGERVTFTHEGRLIELDPVTGSRRTILTADDTILAYAWSPNGRRVAFIEVNYERDSVHHLKIRDLDGDRITELKTLGAPLGRGTHDDDEVSLAWSRDGSKLLVNDTHLDETFTVRVLSTENGADVIPAMKNATNAMFASDERSMIVRLTPHSGPRTWVRVDLADGAREGLDHPANAYHAELSPDGGSIAFLRFGAARNAFSVDVYDLARGARLASVSGYRDPVWLSADTLAATRIADCPKDDSDCEYYGWRGVGVWKIDLSGRASKVALGTTLWDGSRVDVRFD